MVKRKWLSLFTLALMIFSIIMPYDVAYSQEIGGGGSEEVNVGSTAVVSGGSIEVVSGGSIEVDSGGCSDEDGDSGGCSGEDGDSGKCGGSNGGGCSGGGSGGSGHTITGIVTGSSGPLADVGIQLLKEGAVKHTTVTDANGCYSFSIKGNGGFLIKVGDVDGYLKGQTKSFRTKGSDPVLVEVNITLIAAPIDSNPGDDDGEQDPGGDDGHGEDGDDHGNSDGGSGHNLTGIIMGNEGPIPNATVNLFKDGILKHTTNTDENGQYSFKVGGNGEFEIKVDEIDEAYFGQTKSFSAGSSDPYIIEINITLVAVPGEENPGDNDGQDPGGQDPGGDDSHGGDGDDHGSGDHGDGEHSEKFIISGSVTFNGIPVGSEKGVKVVFSRGMGDHEEGTEHEAGTGTEVQLYSTMSSSSEEAEEHTNVEVPVVDGKYRAVLEGAGWYNITLMRSGKQLEQKRKQLKGKEAESVVDFNIEVPIVNVNVASGRYNTNLEVELSVVNIPSTIYYALNDGENWTVYDAPIAIANEGISTLKYYAESLNTAIESDIEESVYEIDTIPPTVELQYSTTKLTYGSVTVTLIPSEAVTITNNEGKFTYVFTRNGEFEFTFADAAGNIGTAIARVSNIRIPSPIDHGGVDNPGNQPSVPTDSIQDQMEVPIVIVNPEHGLYNTEINVKLSVTNIPDAIIYYNLDDGDEWMKYTDAIKITKEGTTLVRYYAERINTVIKSNVEEQRYQIDTIPPKVELKYSTTMLTNKSVTVTLVTEEDITITNNNGNNTYLFEENGEFQFEFTDAAGNKGIALAVVKNIDKTVPNVKNNIGEGTYEVAQKVELTLSEEGAIYYTTDGSIPTKESDQYTEEIVIDQTTILKYIAVDNAGNSSEVYENNYIIEVINVKNLPNTGNKNMIMYELMAMTIAGFGVMKTYKKRKMNA